jgi:hypothetical protein
MPGAGFKVLAKKWAKAFDDMVEEPYVFAKQLIVRSPFDLLCSEA